MRVLRIVLVVAAATLFLGRPAQAACHFFTVAAASSVGEGAPVTVKITRDAGAAPSSVRVQTVNGTATAPGDYTKFDQRVSFQGQNDVEKNVTIQTKQDNIDEQDEKFTVKVSDAQGCAVNPNYGYGPPAQITIKDDDQPAPTTAATTAPTTAPQQTVEPGADPPTPSPTATASATPTGSPSPSPSGSPSATPTFSPLAVEKDDIGFPWLPVAAVLGFLGAGTGALMLYRMRRGAV